MVDTEDKRNKNAPRGGEDKRLQHEAEDAR